MININKNKLTIDIESGSQEVRDNLIENTGFSYLDDDNYILAFDTENTIVFCSAKEIRKKIDLLEDYEKEAVAEVESADFDPEDITIKVMRKLSKKALKYFTSLSDFIYETIQEEYSAECELCGAKRALYERTVKCGQIICRKCDNKVEELKEEDTEHQKNIEFENKSMAEYLQKLGFNQDDISNIANGCTTLFTVSVICENVLEEYLYFSTKAQAETKYLELCKEWYQEEGFEKFQKNYPENSEVTLIDRYQEYYGSIEYHNACDNANITIEETK